MFRQISSFWGLTSEEKVLDVNNNVISRNVYEYGNTDQGATLENFLFYDAMTYTATPRYSLSILHHYPVVLTRTNTYGMGSYTKSQTLQRDQITGESILVSSTGQNGSTSLSSKIPAFRISSFSAMGPKSINSSNKNFLSYDAYSFTTIDTALTPITSGIGSSFLGAGAKLFTTVANVRSYAGALTPFTTSTTSLLYWKEGASYGWSGIQGSLDQYGLYNRSELISNPFNFSTPSSNSAHWRFGSETTLSDGVGHALETRGYNNRFNSLRFGFNNDYVIATCANSNYSSFTYSGFESIMPNTSNNFAEGEMSLPSGNYTLVPTATIAPHTGYFSLALTGGSASYYVNGFSNNGTYETGVERGRIYRAIVWVNSSANSGTYLQATVTGSVSGSSYTQNYTMYANDANAITVGGWKRLSVDFTVPSNIVPNGSGQGVTITLYSASVTNYFDDLMFYPVEGNIKASVYNQGTGRVVAELNNLGYATFYTYDEAGRPLDTQQEIPGTGIILVKHNSYNFARTN